MWSRGWWWPALAAALILGAAIGVAVAVLASGGSSPGGGLGALATNPVVDPGTPLGEQAPDFTLTDQFGRSVSLHSFRGRAVLLAFVDSQCTTVCPLTTQEMVAARRLLGASADRVALLGIDANPEANAVGDVRAYSRTHGMLHQWQFLTAPLPQLKRVWKAYGIEVEIVHGLIDHTPALYAISPDGMLARVYLTQMAYTSIGQQAQVLARELATLLPGHPAVDSNLSYQQVSLTGPRSRVTLPRANSGRIRLGPGKPRLLVFFASWLSETSDLTAQLGTLNRYQAAAGSSSLPSLVAVDEGSVEPTPSALPRLLRRLRHPLSYPVAIDRSGRLADGYHVADQPWYVLTSQSGRILWHHDGWLPLTTLERNIRDKLGTR